MRFGNLILSTMLAFGATHLSAAGTRLIDGGESAQAWEDGHLGGAAVVKGITAGTDPAPAGSHVLVVALDGLDGAQDSATMTWPHQAGVQTNAIPAACVDMAQAKAVRVSLYAEPDSASGTGLLQARIYLKTGPEWLWHTTEALDGNSAFTDLYAGSWITLESPVENFYSGGTARGILHPEQLKSVGIQFFTWGGSWTGKVLVDQVELVDSVATSAVRPRVARREALQGGAVPRRYDANGRRAPAALSFRR